MIPLFSRVSSNAHMIEGSVQKYQQGISNKKEDQDNFQEKKDDVERMISVFLHRKMSQLI